MPQIVSGIVLSVQSELLDIAGRLTVSGRIYLHAFPVFKVYGHLLKQRRAEDIFIASGADRIKAHGREDKPGRCLSIVLIPAITVGCRSVELIHHLTGPVLRLPGFAGVVVEIYHMLNGLVSMSILSHVHDLHLPDLMYWKTVIAVVENRRHLEYRIEHVYKHPFPPHQVNQPLRVVENRPGVVPAVALGKGVTPFGGTEGRLERAILVLSPHQVVLG